MIPGYDQVGTCSECGGAIYAPRLWGSVDPYPFKCSECGAEPIQRKPPVIECERPESKDSPIGLRSIAAVSDERIQELMRESVVARYLRPLRGPK